MAQKQKYSKRSMKQKKSTKQIYIPRNLICNNNDILNRGTYSVNNIGKVG